MSAQYTPGPWYSRDTSAQQAIIASEANGKTVALAYDPADGPLLALAPEMLEALRGALEAAEQLHKYLPSTRAFEVAERVRAAIAKAEGREG